MPCTFGNVLSIHAVFEEHICGCLRAALQYTSACLHDHKQHGKHINMPPTPRISALVVFITFFLSGTHTGNSACAAQADFKPCHFPNVTAAVQRFSQVIQFKTVSDLSTSNHVRYPEEFSKLDAFLQAAYTGRVVLHIASASAAAAALAGDADAADAEQGQKMLHSRAITVCLVWHHSLCPNGAVSAKQLNSALLMWLMTCVVQRCGSS
jgi:hypothetical protein